MGDLNDAQLHAMLAQADQQQRQVPMVEHILNGAQIMVGDEQLPNGQFQKVLIVAHPSGHTYITKMTAASAKDVAKGLLKPPVPVISNGHAAKA